MGHGISNAVGLLGGVMGGAVGVIAFGWIARQGFYAPFLIGGLVGVGCFALARHPSWGRGIACGVIALALGVYAEWREFPFVADRRFRYFLAHLNDLQPLTWLMMLLGAALAVWLGRDHRATGARETARHAAES